MTLKPATSIPPQAWMKSASTCKVMDALGAGEALFVGGCVRNAVLGIPVEDIDIATKLTPEVVMEKLNAIGVKTIATGIDHGTITAVCDDQSFEITTLRKDVATDGRRATIAFSTDWQEDAARRDFTMNTLLADGEGNIYDPLGQGVEDLKAGRVIFVGEARQRIAEDILRILRFFRFHALYGKGDPDEDALTACREFADKIPELSRERITQEFLKIISVDDPVDILTLMFENNILKQFNFNETKLIVLKYTCDFQRRYGLGFVASRLYALAGFSLKNVEAMENLLLLPKVFKKDMEAIDKILQLPDLNNDHAVKVAIYDHGRVPTAQALMIELATDRVMNGYVLKALEIIQNWDIPDFPLSGEDLIKEGFKPGPVLGEELTRRERAWIDNGFSQ